MPYKGDMLIPWRVSFKIGRGAKLSQLRIAFPASVVGGRFNEFPFKSHAKDKQRIYLWTPGHGKIDGFKALACFVLKITHRNQGKLLVPMVQPLFENMPQLQGIWNKETFPAKIMEVENHIA